MSNVMIANPRGEANYLLQFIICYFYLVSGLTFGGVIGARENVTIFTFSRLFPCCQNRL